MIAADQPQCFGVGVVAGVSSRNDGYMQLGRPPAHSLATAHRRDFLAQLQLTPEQTTLLKIHYDDHAQYDVIKTVGPAEQGQGLVRPVGEPADCLVTTTPGLGLFLLIADCVGTVVHDPKQGVLALAHLGRHSSIAHLASKLVSYLQTTFSCRPSDLIIWLSPSIKSPHYVLQTTTFAQTDSSWQPYCQPIPGGYSLDLPAYNQSQFVAAGVPAHQIHVSPVDTATNQEYWSHYTATTIQHRPAPPRFAVAAALTRHP